MKYSALLALILCGNIAFADQNNGFFVGGNAAYISSDTFVNTGTEAEKFDITLSAIELVAGYKYNPWLGIDLRYGSSLSDHEDSINGAAPIQGFEYSINSYQSIYYRPEITNREAKLYFLLGYTTLDATTETLSSDGDFSVEYSESGTSYGMGAGWFIGDDLVINVEYRQLLDKEEEEFSIITLGADYRF